MVAQLRRSYLRFSRRAAAGSSIQLSPRSFVRQIIDLTHRRRIFLLRRLFHTSPLPPLRNIPTSRVISPPLSLCLFAMYVGVCVCVCIRVRFPLFSPRITSVIAFPAISSNFRCLTAFLCSLARIFVSSLQTTAVFFSFAGIYQFPIVKSSLLFAVGRSAFYRTFRSVALPLSLSLTLLRSSCPS